MEKKDKKFNTAVVSIISWPGLFCARGALGSFFNGKSLDRRTLPH
jgi:hypothetical protein